MEFKVELKFDRPYLSFAEEMRVWRFNYLIRQHFINSTEGALDAKNLLRASTTVA